MRIRRKRHSLKSMHPGLAWIMATTAMVHFSVYAPEPARSKEPSNEEGTKKKKWGLPSGYRDQPNDNPLPDGWQSAPLPIDWPHTLARPRLVAQLGDDKQREFDFDILPQALASALIRFGEQTGIQFAYTAEDVENVRTGGVSGRRTSEDALRLLLIDTGLDYRVTGNNTVTLEKRNGAGAAAVGTGIGMGVAAAGAANAHSEGGTSDAPVNGTPAKPVKVPEVVVKEVAERPVVDSPDGYKADVSSEAVLRFPAPIQELPQSVSVVTRDSIRERRAVTQTEALEGVAGITKAPQFPGNGSDQVIIRGFQPNNADTPGYSRDNGLSAYNNYVADPTLYERIEVIKGASSFTSGLVTAGGFVNRLLKAPVKDNFVVTEAFAGSDGHYRTTLDANGVMPSIPQLSGRFVFSQNQDPEFFRNTGNQRFSFLPSVRFATENDFTVTVTGNIQHLRGKGYYGTPTNTLGQIPAGIQDSLLGPDNELKIDYQSAHIEAEKKFVQGFRLKAKGQYSHDTTKYTYAYGNQPGGIVPNGDFNILGIAGVSKRESWAGEVNLVKDFSLFGNMSSVAAGMDYSMGTKGFTNRYAFLGTGNIANPVVNVPFPSGFTGPPPDFASDHRFQQTGAFVQGLLRPFAGTTLMVALRGNWIGQQVNASFFGVGGNDIGLNTSRLTPQIGLSQRLIEGLNVYAAYGESLQPNFAITANRSLLDPMTGQTYEIGSKWEPLGKRIMLTAALFRTLLDNVATPDPAFPPNSGISIGGQSQRNQGLEVEVRGALLPELQVNLAYTYLDSEVTKSNVPGVVGANAFNTPHHTVSAFGSYDLSELLTKGLKFGAVVYYRSQVSSLPFPGLRDETFEGYTRADLFAIYAPLKWLTLQLNLNNLFDAGYIQGPNRYGAYNQFGAPRHVIGMVRMTF
ncbi:hypothetical protein W02_00030 [Nitrospira sp. KM1]|uniref:TonB-dependent siderophore receptor n=1 Tax=Nitrospira sp. KM1 TaxID=1936990 RepID=UPI0013A7348A|nr:TonB-dependent receptor [Nitrospira sp. KM1]BCA52863.1 hypothetical protein W02_00030 [Nitrospira sp. KM1]